MKSDHNFTAERVLARHCDALIARGPAPRDPKLIVEEFLGNISALLGKSLLPMLGGAPCKIASAELSEGSLSAWRESLDEASMVLGLSGPAGKPEMLVGVDLASAMMLTDIAFGGTGDRPKTLPEQWPMASLSVMETLGKHLAERLANALKLSTKMDIVSDWRDRSKASFLCGANELYWTSFAPVDANDGNWSITLAIPTRHAPILEGGADAVSPIEAGAKVNLARSSMSQIPFKLRCELAQIKMPISRAANLAVGDTFPLAIPREVPLEIASQIVARGAIGALDEKVAVEVTHLGQS